MGVGVTVVCVWLALRDAPFAEVGRVIARANWWLLLGLSIPAYLLMVYERALRWGYLVAPIRPLGKGPLFRGVSVGFLANNVFPLRMGEVVRAWYLARETGVSTASLFVTVVLERVIDTTMVVLMAFFALTLWGASGDRAIARGALLLLPVAVMPLAVLVGLRLRPERAIAVARFLLRPFPERVPAWVERVLRRFSEGLGALRGGWHLFWIAVHTLSIWLVLSPIPLLAGFWALKVDLGTFLETLGASWLTLVAVGVAVALPSAPGFFGPYHVACKLALERFGVAPETAVALGTLFHAVMWGTLTALGLIVLRVRRTSLAELGAATGPPDRPAPR